MTIFFEKFNLILSKRYAGGAECRLYTSVRGPSFRHGLPESSHKDVNLGAGNLPESSTCATNKLPSLDMDSGRDAGIQRPGMAGSQAPAWEPLSLQALA